MLRALLFAAVTAASTSLAQGSPEPRIVVVPFPGEVVDAGAPPAQVTPPPVEVQGQPPATNDVPPAEPGPRTIDAISPPPPPSTEPGPVTPPQPDQPGAFLDGHPRTGAFLSGPGSFTFVLHHTLMGGVGLLATQMAPRIGDAITQKNGDLWTNQDARIAYLTGTLIGAGVGFGIGAWWQFNHWISESTALFGIINGLIGGMFMAGIANLVTNNPAGISWSSLIGLELGSWLTAVIGGGDLPVNQGTLIASGAGWAAIYTLLIMAMIAPGGGISAQGFVDAMLIVPAVGAAAMWAATLKFNPSTMQIMRANLFGVGVGGAVLVISALALGFNFLSPVPYLLGGLGAIGAKTIVSLLWAEAAEPGRVAALSLDGYDARGRYRRVWW